MNEKGVKTRTFRDSLLEKWVLVDFQIENERKSSKNANISWFTIGKVSIGRFSNSKWARRPRNQRSQVILLFDNRSLVDFPIGNERKREFHPAEIRFYLHKEFRAAEIRFYLHKEFRAAGTRFYLHTLGIIGNEQPNLNPISYLKIDQWSVFKKEMSV